MRPGFSLPQVQQPDVKASNGLVHGITRVMFPPPVFNKTMYETMMNETEITALVPGLEPAGDAAAEAALPIPGVTAEGAVQEEAPADAAAAAPEDAAPADGAAAAEPEVVAQGLLFGKFIG